MFTNIIDEEVADSTPSSASSSLNRSMGKLLNISNKALVLI